MEHTHGTQPPTGTHYLFYQSQASVSRNINIIIKELLKLSGNYIRCPSNDEEILANIVGFMDKFGMPRIFDAFDGSQ